MKIKELIKDLGMDVGISGTVATVLDTLKNGVHKKLTQEHRAEMLAFVRSLAAIDPQASENLLRRQRERQTWQPRSYDAKNPYVPGDENLLVELLTKLYKALDEPEKRETRKQTFKWLGRLDDEKFDATLEFLNHDVLKQWSKRLGLWFKKIEGGSLFPKLDQEAKGIAAEIQKKNEEFGAKRKRFTLYK